MGESVVERNLNYAVYAALTKTDSTTVELKTEGDVFPERRYRREGVHVSVPFEGVGGRVGGLFGIRRVREGVLSGSLDWRAGALC